MIPAKRTPLTSTDGQLRCGRVLATLSSMLTSEVADNGRAPLEAEVVRLRRLVGPNEMSYADVQGELLQARDAVRAAETRAGELRGEITELRYTLHRAVQDQHHIRRTVLSPVLKVRHRLRMLRN
jgi:hypothetical protein